MGAPPEHAPDVLAPARAGAPVEPSAPPCGEDKPCQRPDAGIPPGKVLPSPATSQAIVPGATEAAFMVPPDDDADAQPAAVAPKKPPLDAGPDGPVNLPPIPDAGPILPDAWKPQRVSDR